MSDVTRVEEIYLEAASRTDPAERADYLDGACGGNAELRQRVNELLAAHTKVGQFLEPPADLTQAYRSVDGDTVAFTVGQIIAERFKLLERIGEGGMGEVWVADQLAPVRRRVAVKLIKPGMDSRGVLARFDAERQALAVMDHPNIAKVLDAGTTADGRPYFVMELVKGTPITEFADARKLTPKERLELMVPVCQAIQHAHMKGIIHRDIKPSNVLVELHDDRLVPKVIDFGVAKAVGQQLTEKTIYTGLGALVGTPAYMAPEQATFNALDIDTRADVYALGVLLYELLAGSPPIETERMKRAALDEVLRIVRDEEPPRPSQRLSTSQAKASIAAVRGSEPVKLSQLMKGELDWIVMKALEKDRTRRYDTPTALAKDVQRYLSGDAVEACPPTLGYRLRKAYRRNRAAVRVGTAFLVMIALGVGMLVYTWQQRFARQSATEQIVTESLTKATLLRGQASAAPVGELSKWTEAITAVKQAEASLQTGEPSETLRQRVAELLQSLETERREAEQRANEAEKDRKLVERIEAIRVQYVDADEVWFSERENKESPINANEAYAEAFRVYGIDVDQVEPAEAGKHLRQRPQAQEIAFAIDAWSLIRKDLARDEKTGTRDAEKDRLYRRLVELACVIDPDPFRCGIRKHEDVTVQHLETIKSPTGKSVVEKSSLLEKIMNDPELAKQPARVLYVIGLRIEHSRGDWFGKPKNYDKLTPTLALWKRAWQLRPSDFQICWTLAKECRDDVEKRTYAMAAVAAAPQSQFAKEWNPSAEDSTVIEPLLNQIEHVKKGDKAPEWKFPHVVIESSLGEKVFIGPTRYPALSDEQRKTLDREVQELRWTIRLQPMVRELHTQLAKKLVRLGRFDEALAICGATPKPTSKFDAGESIELELYGMGQLDKAKEMLEPLIREHRTSYLSELYPILGLIHTEQGRRHQAFECFRDAYRRMYTTEDGHFVNTTISSWDDAMLCIGTIEQVTAAYQKWIQLVIPKKQGSAYLSEELGYYLVKHGKTEEALAVYHEALTRKDGEKVLYQLSRLLVRLKRPDEAIAVYKDAIAKNPKEIDLRKSLANLYEDLGKSAERLATLRELVPLYQERIQSGGYSRQPLAWTYRDLGQIEDARRVEREMLNKGVSPMILNSDAMRYATSNDPNFRDPDMALDFAKRACELTQYSQSMILDTLATAYATKGDFDNAVKWQLKAIELCDDNSMEEYQKNLKLFREKKPVPREKWNK
jgi:tetratricopeptide (TPR) repeat protein/tRNA A-37 threonylcarbamoyl transferase component Bud32